MAEAPTTEQAVKVRAYSPGRFPILVVEPPDGGLLTVYSETGYSLQRSKSVGRDWLRENAIGRHGFIGIEPPREMPAGDLEGFVDREIRTGSDPMGSA